MGELGIGIIGSGYMGRTYAECVSHYNTGARLVAVAGGSRAPSLAADYSVTAEADVEALLQRADVDVVIITSPQSAHREQTVSAAQHGKHILVEKPMATSVKDCQDMIATCRAHHVSLSVIKPWRYRGSTRGLQDSIRRGDIGDVRMISLWWLYPRPPFVGKEWFRDPREGGFYLDAGSHCFDFLRWVANAEPTRLFAQLATYNQDSATPRSTMTNVAFANGVMAQLWLSYEVPPPGWQNTDFRARVVGSTGELDAHGYGLLQLSRGEAWQTLYEQGKMDYINRPMERVRLEAFFDMTQDFFDAIRDARTPPVTGEDGLKAVAMVEAGYRSSESGQAVDLTT
ncbi:MAG TPA: Gfo/Idh/MocA family oxidoreductase [Chloroflexota bacterium]|nr:Gfo/Idh/MocA family oxidoreductase [Chloroflexota bacterium]